MGRIQSTLAVPAALIGLVLANAGSLRAQQRPGPEIRVTPSGEVLDFHRDGAWRKEARRVSEYRARMLAQGNFAALNAPAAPGFPSASVVSGTKNVPAIMFRFQDVGTNAGNDTSLYSALLFGATAPVGKPYSFRSFYSQLSNGMLDITGKVAGWVTLDNPEASYTGGANCAGQSPNGSNCNGLFGSSGTLRLAGLTEAVTKVDATVDFSQFDSDADGFVDFVLFYQSETDGACGTSHLWSHRSQLPTYTTNDPGTGGNVKIRDYILMSAGGGSGGCSVGMMNIGTTAHESGHAFGLPDLYDTQSSTAEGVGQWSLMSSGNYTTTASPARMDAWSLNELGWITVRQITTSGTYTFGPVPTSDTAFVVRVQGSNPRKEYYFLENRQAVHSDSAMIRSHCSQSGLTFPTNCHGGLAIWHVDSTKVNSGRFSNTMNTGSIYGLRLVQADGLNQLEAGGNRGNAGDVWPGYGTGTPKTVYSFSTTPKAVANDSSTFTGFQIDQIALVSAGLPDGAMSLRIQFGGLTVVRALDTLAKVKVDGATTGRFAGLFADGSTHSVTMDSPQLINSNRTQYTFVSWSDGGLQTHNVTGAITGDSITLNVATQHKVTVTTSGTGAVASSPSVDLVAGTFRDKGTTIQLTATPGAGQLFDRWTGDSSTTTNPITLTMNKPYTLNAAFVAPLTVSSAAPAAPVMGKPYTHTFTSAGGTGSTTWSVFSGTLPAGLSLTSAGVLSGTATASGAATFTVRAASGTQTSNSAVSFTVTEPTLVVANVLQSLLGAGSGTAISADDIKYMDLLGNNNGGLDVGDFLAWVNKTNATPAPPAPGGEGTVTP